jgi:diacylglycerol kinase (ATP)
MAKNYIQSFSHAFRGFVSFFSLEPNSFIHLAAAVAVAIVAWWNHITPFEWLWLLACISLVFITEMLNSAIEKLCDVVEPEQHPQIKIIKDISAAAVLLASIFSVVVGIIILGPYLL